MKKNRLIIILAVAIMTIAITACSGAPSDDFTLDLSELKNESSVFCYKGLDWDNTAAETQEILNFNLGEAVTSEVVNEGYPTVERSMYNPLGKVKLMKQVGGASLEFRDDKLTSIVFGFNEKGDKLKEFGEKVLEELVKLYSDEYTLKERVNEERGLTTTTYDWELLNQERMSHLQLLIVEQEDSYSVNIGVLCPRKQEKLKK